MFLLQNSELEIMSTYCMLHLGFGFKVLKKKCSHYHVSCYQSTYPDLAEKEGDKPPDEIFDTLYAGDLLCSFVIKTGC